MIARIIAQEDTGAVVDTLTKSFDKKWQAMDQMSQAGPLYQAAASHDLIYIVLGVSLIIWFVLLFFIIRLDRKVSRLEERTEAENTPENISDS